MADDLMEGLHEILRRKPHDFDADGSWVHAYLHRKEGDQGNAGYWYDRAGRPFCKESLQAEWETLVSELLTK